MKSNFRNLQKKNIQIAFLLLNYFIGLIKTSSPLNLVYILLHWKIQANNFMSTHKIHRIPASFQYTYDITFSVRDVVKLKLFEAKFDCVEFMFEFEAPETLALIVFKYYHYLSGTDNLNKNTSSMTDDLIVIFHVKLRLGPGSESYDASMERTHGHDASELEK